MRIRPGDAKKYWFATGGRFSGGDVIRYDTGVPETSSIMGFLW